MRITDLMELGDRLIPRVATLLLDSFRDAAPHARPDMAWAMGEVQASLAEGRISRVALNEQHEVEGWSGAIREYQGRVWQVYPFIVRPAARAKGVGSALLDDLENQVRARGGLTMWVRTADETGQTSLGNCDLYPDLVGKLAAITNLAQHPYEFYLRKGYSLSGVMPDAHGWGKPDIFLAKRVGGPSASPSDNGKKSASQ